MYCACSAEPCHKVPVLLMCLRWTGWFDKARAWSDQTDTDVDQLLSCCCCCTS